MNDRLFNGHKRKEYLARVSEKKRLITLEEICTNYAKIYQADSNRLRAAVKNFMKT